MMNPKMHPSRRRSVNSEFERETKLVVLNFMGLVPASCPATADVCDVTVDISSEEEEEDMRPRSHSAGPSCDLQPALEQPAVENCSAGTTVVQNGAVSSQRCTAELVDSERIKNTEIVVDACVEDGRGHLDEIPGREQLGLDCTAASARHQLPNKSASQLHSGMLQIPSSSRSPSPLSASGLPLVERQSSLRSTASSLRSSPRSGSINVQQADVEALVKTHSLPPLVIPLRDELTHEMEVLGQGHHDDDAAQGI